ncbi:MAG: hypothetical protein JNJ54_35770 [Myxococcaceae bacterium]|nr:hypothetical protein [Myxococcaceae bacterium]
MAKWFGAVIVVAAFGLVGCGAAEQCSAALSGSSCAKGTVEACCTSTQCRYKTSDGKSFACEATDCAKANSSGKSAAMQAAEWCTM